MLGLVHPFDALGAVPAGHTDAVFTMAKVMAQDLGLTPLFITAGAKTPAETRTQTDLKKATKAAQEEARERGNPDWNRVRAGGGGYKLGIEPGTTTAAIKGAYTRALARQKKQDDGTPAPLNLGMVLDGHRVLVVDCDTEQSVEDFVSMAVGWGISLQHPTVVSPGAQDDSGAWKHSGGGHFWFSLPEGVDFADVPSFNVGDGSDAVSFMTTRKYVLVPPSTRPEGHYRWLGGVHECTPEMVEYVRDHAKDGYADRNKTNQTKQSTPVEQVTEQDHAAEFAAALANDNDGIDEWAASTSWEDLLTSRGWTKTDATSACGCWEYTAPGEHASRKSATAHESYCTEYRPERGHGPLYIWTDFPPEGLEDRKTWTKLQFVTAVDHGGDTAAAMRALGIAAEDTTDYSGLIAVSEQIAQSAKESTADTANAQVTEPQPSTPTTRGGLALVVPDGDTPTVTPAVTATVAPAVPATVPATVPPTVTEDEERDPDPLPAGVEVLKFRGVDYGDHRPNLVCAGEYAVYVTDFELDKITSMIAWAEDQTGTVANDESRLIIAAAVMRGEDPFDSELYPSGAPYEPELVKRVFEPYAWTRSVFEHATNTRTGRGVSAPITSLTRELVRAAHRLPVGVKTWRGTPLSLYGVFVGESGKGKSYALNTANLSPWPDDEVYGWFKPGAGSSTTAPEIACDYGDRTADQSVEPRSGQVIPKFFLEKTVELVETGDNDENGEPITKPQSVLKKIDHPSAVIITDELSTLMAVSSGDGSTMVHTLDSAFSAQPIGGMKVSDSENTRVEGDYRLQMLVGMQASRFGDVMYHAGSGFPQRLLLAQTTWPWAGWDFGIRGTRDPETPTQIMPRIAADTRFTVDPAIVNRLSVLSSINAAVAVEADEAAAIATHSDDVRVRVACLGALLNGTTHVDAKLWEWAGAVIEMSSRAFDFAVGQSGRTRRKEAHAKGEELAITQSTARTFAEQEDGKLYARVAQLLLEAGPRGMTLRDIRSHVARKRRPELAGLLESWSVADSLRIKKLPTRRANGSPRYAHVEAVERSA